MSENYREIIPLHEVLLRFYTYIFNPFNSKMKLEDLTDDQIKSLVMEDLKKVEEEVGFQGYPLTYDYEAVIKALINRRNLLLEGKYIFSSRKALIDSWMRELRDCNPYRIAIAAIKQRVEEKYPIIHPAMMQVKFDEYLEARINIPWEIEESLGTDKIDDYPWKELNINFRVRSMQARILQPYLVDFLYEQKLL